MSPAKKPGAQACIRAFRLPLAMIAAEVPRWKSVVEAAKISAQ
jgi:hypothetical protein